MESKKRTQNQAVGGIDDDDGFSTTQWWMMMDFDHSMTHKETRLPSVLTGYGQQMCDHAACNRSSVEANGSKVHCKPRGFFHTGGYKG